MILFASLASITISASLHYELSCAERDKSFRALPRSSTSPMPTSVMDEREREVGVGYELMGVKTGQETQDDVNEISCLL